MKRTENELEHWKNIVDELTTELGKFSTVICLLDGTRPNVEDYGYKQAKRIISRVLKKHSREGL